MPNAKCEGGVGRGERRVENGNFSAAEALDACILCARFLKKMLYSIDKASMAMLEMFACRFVFVCLFCLMSDISGCMATLRQAAQNNLYAFV